MSPLAHPDPYAHLDAAYVLDALAPAERADFEAHLRECPSCRAAVDDVAGVIRRLDGIDGSAFDAMPTTPPVPDAVLPGLLIAAGRARRRRRAIGATLGGLVAASFLTLAVLVSMLMSDRAPATPLSGSALPTSTLSGGAPVAQPMTPVAATAVSADVTLRATDWGTEIDLNCWDRSSAPVPSGYAYTLTVRGLDGTTHQLGTWQLVPGRQVRFTSGTALTLGEIAAVDISDSYGSRLLTLAR